MVVAPGAVVPSVSALFAGEDATIDLYLIIWLLNLLLVSFKKSSTTFTCFFLIFNRVGTL